MFFQSLGKIHVSSEFCQVSSNFDFYVDLINIKRIILILRLTPSFLPNP